MKMSMGDKGVMDMSVIRSMENRPRRVIPNLAMKKTKGKSSVLFVR
jgi:hypothetical protein